ncbi:protein-glutamine gamma-glutamyltransferase [Rossellomorea aquimaris]|uniref:Protein-glutamine gamma-glutamyltransferase n=2 Tax=Bacillaceae TaxID=186817 RepID=A0A5D4TDJ8_9BACI|nr:protein-glutamine gamma-glutamyltransferase [Rossellomorea aquimaris]
MGYFMISVAGRQIQQVGSLNLETIEEEIAKRIHDAKTVYSYPSMKDLLFELKTRRNIIESAKEMSESKVVFTTFQYAACNPAYWDLTAAGGFRLRQDVRPSEAVQDIYRNSALYAFECATACVIIFYHAVLKSISPSAFNSLFQDIYLYSWHADPDLGVNTFYGDHYLPGDVVYFNNPDYSAENPWYRGVNAVVLEDGQFFGHGFGISSSDQIIEFLNEVRSPDSNQPAYLANLVTRLSFTNLEQYGTVQRNRKFKQHIVVHHNKSSLSCIRHRAYLNKGLFT